MRRFSSNCCPKSSARIRANPLRPRRYRYGQLRPRNRRLPRLRPGWRRTLGAAEKVIEKGRRIAAHNLEAAEVDIEFSAGRFITVAGTDRGLDMKEVAALAFQPATLPPGMERRQRLRYLQVAGPDLPERMSPYQVEIDPETGVVTVLRYLAVDDVGTVMNPLLLKGQLHGGIVQGIAQILGERIVMDESGQVLTGSFMDYHMPRADEYPSFEIESHIVPSPRNRLALRAPVKPEPLGPLLPGERDPRCAGAARYIVDRLSRQRRNGYGKR